MGYLRKFTLLLACLTPWASFATTDRLAALQKRDAAAIARYEAGEAELTRARASLDEAASEENGADAARLSAEIRRKTREQSGLRADLRQYLAALEEDRIVNEVAPQVKEGATKAEVTRAIECLQTRSLETPELGRLYSHALSIANHLSQQLAFRLMRRTPGYRDRACAPAGPSTECWETESGSPYYVTRGNLRVDSSCLIHGDGWESFPTDPGAYVRAADRATDALTGCFARLNRESAESVALQVSTHQPYVACRDEGPETEGDRHCARATENGNELILTRPMRCGDLSRTVFHELLHLGSFGNLELSRHNSPLCQRYDAVYACSELCFPPAAKDRRATEYSCSRCVSESQQSRLCGRLPAAAMDDQRSNCTGGR